MQFAVRKPLALAVAATTLVIGGGVGVAFAFTGDGAHVAATTTSAASLSTQNASGATALNASVDEAKVSTPASVAVTTSVPGAVSADASVTGTVHPPKTDVDPHTGLGVSTTMDDLAVAAKAIGITESALKTALESGQSLADIATAHGVAPSAVISALVAAATTQIDAAVTGGKLTQTEATTLIGHLTTAITALVNRTDSDAGSGGGKDSPLMGMLGDPLSIVAKALGITESTLKTDLANGQSLAQIATAIGVSPTTLISGLVSEATTFINALVTKGVLTQAQATSIISDLTSAVTAIVNGTIPNLGSLSGIDPGSLGLGSLKGLQGLALASGLPGLGSLNLSSLNLSSLTSLPGFSTGGSAQAGTGDSHVGTSFSGSTDSGQHHSGD
jgi:urease accessory protein UreF